MADMSEKRKHVRYTCEGGVEVMQVATANATGRGFWGTLADVSLGGCYVQTFSPLNVGTEVTWHIKALTHEIRGMGKIATFHPGVGMGIEFTSFPEGETEKLADLVNILKAEQEKK